jgi:anti-sigma regulatory factor (Ser/Thr protein kinase)/serine/threonine protein phosphatase PrpC
VLPLLSGNEFSRMSFPFELVDSSQVGEARRFALVLCSELDFEETRQGRVGIIVNELGNNLVRYASHSRLIFRKFSDSTGVGVEILSIDSGPGLDIDRALEDGYSTGGTPGTGLGSVRRLSDVFDIHSSIEKGTVVLSRVNSRTPIHVDGSGVLEIGAVNIALAGEDVCGDSWCVKQSGTDYSVLVVDGLGHGPFANQAASIAVDSFLESAAGGVAEAMQHIHSRLKGSRGAAVFIVKIQNGSASFVGVGNIRAVLKSETEMKTLITQNGTAGLNIGSLKVFSQPWESDGFLILHSDGISSRWDLSAYPGIIHRHPSILAAVLYRDYSRGTDDSTVVVVRKMK